MNPKPSKRQRFKNFILRRKLNTLGLLVITVMSALITLACAFHGFIYTDILIFVTVLLVALCFVQVGMLAPEKQCCYAHHHGMFKVDEDVLPLCVAWMTANAERAARS